MKLDYRFLRSKVARRIFLLFIVCAMVPITILGILSFWQVTNQLREQSLARLKESAKAYGMRTAFIDRRKRPFGETPHQPDLIVASFAELAATLA